MEHDNSGEYPHELHRDLAKDGWIGIALPEDLGGAGLGISEATMMLHTIAECGPLPVMPILPNMRQKRSRHCRSPVNSCECVCYPSKSPTSASRS